MKRLAFVGGMAFLAGLVACFFAAPYAVEAIEQASGALRR